MCFRVVLPCRRACVCPCVRASVIHVVVLCFCDISSICWRMFAKLLSLVHLGTEMNWLDFGVKRSKVKVTAWPNTSQIFVFPRYLQYLLTDFRQTSVTSASRDRDELFRFWGQKVKVQGHGMTECIPDFHVSTISPVSIDKFSPNSCHSLVHLGNTDDLITFLGQRVKVQGHTIAAEAHSNRRYRRVQLFLVWFKIFLWNLGADQR